MRPVGAAELSVLVGWCAVLEGAMQARRPVSLDVAVSDPSGGAAARGRFDLRAQMEAHGLRASDGWRRRPPQIPQTIRAVRA